MFFSQRVSQRQVDYIQKNKQPYIYNNPTLEFIRQNDYEKKFIYQGLEFQQKFMQENTDISPWSHQKKLNQFHKRKSSKLQNEIQKIKKPQLTNLRKLNTTYSQQMKPHLNQKHVQQLISPSPLKKNNIMISMPSIKKIRNKDLRQLNIQKIKQLKSKQIEKHQIKYRSKKKLDHDHLNPTNLIIYNSLPSKESPSSKILKIQSKIYKNSNSLQKIQEKKSEILKGYKFWQLNRQSKYHLHLPYVI